VDCPNNSRSIKKALARAHIETNNQVINRFCVFRNPTFDELAKSK
jgi:hypothetical protein